MSDDAAFWDGTPEAGQESASPPKEIRPPEFSDDALALRFTAEHEGRLLHVAASNKWFFWTGAAWRVDETLEVFDRVRVICRQAASECDQVNVAKAVASAKTIAAVERLARADRRHAAVIDQFDADDWLLNTPGGVVDLRTGFLREHSPDDYMTRMTAAAPSGECPRFLQFLDRITGGDKELQSYMQRVAGYSLTGITREHALFFGHGTGKNGKGTFINTLAGVMGSYAATAPMETFMAARGDRHPAELAMLCGERLVTAQETEEGRRWNESRIKSLTGGDPITARFMRKDFFTYISKFKLFFTGNHKPVLRKVDEAIRRRFNLIPFNIKIEPADPGFPDSLKEEWPGILSWAIEGCLEWQALGLAPCATVAAATDDYLEAQDALGAWVVERCILRPDATTGVARLFASWKAYAADAGERPGATKTFSESLVEKGFNRRKTGGLMVFDGIALQAPGLDLEEAAD